MPSQRLRPVLEDRASFDESFRVLRANLSAAVAGVDHPIVLITSAQKGEGKTTTCCHLGTTFSLVVPKVVVVDLDLRRPEAHRLLGASNEFGVSDVLLGKCKLSEAIQHPASHLSFLAGGPAVGNPADLLGGGRAARLLAELAADADIVLIDSPPVLTAADTLILGPLAAGAVLVAEANRTGIDSLEKAKDLLIRNRTRILGVTLNRSDGARTGYSNPFAAEPGAASGNGASPD